MLKVKKYSLKYLISSHVDYKDICLPILLDSIKSIPEEQIQITICGNNECVDAQYKGIDTSYVTHNSWEYSSLINLIERRNIHADYVFLLHDTMKCGKNFPILSKNLKGCCQSHLCSTTGICNIGAYNVEYLHSIKEKILEFKNCNKRKACSGEGSFYKPCDLISYYPYKITNKPSFPGWDKDCGFEIQGEKDIYKTGTKRTVIYFKTVDAWKYGANKAVNLRAGIVVAKP